MPGHDIIVIGASAGGVEALKTLVAGLPHDLPAAVFVVLHVPAHGTSVLPDILRRAGRLPAVHVADGQPIEHGRIYVAPPDHHLLVKPGRIRVARGPRENGHRPAVDPLFRTAARIYGRRVVGVVLSGVLDDGTAGLMAVKRQGGVAVVQDPEDALYGAMPRSAMENMAVDHVLPVSGIPAALAALAHEEVEASPHHPSEEMEMEADMAELEAGAMQAKERPGTPSAYGCPECGGTLWELTEDEVIRFRCRTGHAYSASTLLAEQSDALEEALWTALRALEEAGSLALRMARRARQRGHDLSADRFEEQARDADQRALIIRDALLGERPADVLPREEDVEAPVKEAVGPEDAQPVKRK